MTNKITALYARNAQANPDRIRRQISNLTVMAEREGFQNLQCFTDDGVSGTTDDRPGLNALMEAIRSNKVATVLVTDGTRLARNYQLFGKLVQEMNDNGVRVILGLEKQQYLPEHIHDDSNGLDYTLHGDYYFPNLLLSAYENRRSIGKWGMMHMDYLRSQHSGQFNQLLLSGELHSYLANLNSQAKERHSVIMKQLKEREGITEDMKRSDHMEWARRMASINEIANEIIQNEMIFI